MGAATDDPNLFYLSPMHKKASLYLCRLCELHNVLHVRRYFVSFDAAKGRIVLTLKNEVDYIQYCMGTPVTAPALHNHMHLSQAHSDITLTCETSRAFVERVDAIAPTEFKSEDFSEEKQQSFLVSED